MPSSKFSGLYLSGRALAILVIVVGISGAMAFYRTHTSPAALWAGITHSDQQPLPVSQVATLNQVSQEEVRLAEHIAPAVVQVNVTAHTGGQPSEMPGGSPGMPPDGGNGGDGQGLPPDNPLSQLFGQLAPQGPHFEAGMGSGIIISPDGYIVTNNHVVKDATEVQVVLSDKRTFNDAKVVGTDVLTDMAVIKINATNLPNLPWGDSRDAKQGELVFAFGNPFGLQFTMTHGIISGKGRLGDRPNALAPGDYLQTDAAINPGNSGGPLVDVRGEVIGINSFIYTSTGSFSGEAFAIPSEIAQPIAAALIAHGKVTRGYLGINIQDLTPELAQSFDLPLATEGAIVTSITAGEAGAEAGLKVGDIITSFNGKKITSGTSLQLDTGFVAPRSTVKLGILRDGKPMTINATLGTAPENLTQATRSAAPSTPTTGVQLGVELQDLTPEVRAHYQIPDDVRGALIARVTPGGPAYNTQGLVTRGEVITEINRVPITSVADARAQLAKLPPGKDVLLRLATGGPQPGAIFAVVHPAPAGSR